MLWTSARLLKQTELDKDSRVEFKEVVFAGGSVSAPRRDQVADELAALGNTIGGTLIFSVSDAGAVRPMNREQMDALEAFVREIYSDSIRPPLAFITQRLALPDGLSVLIVDVERSALVHELLGGAELRLTLPSARSPMEGLEGEVSVTAAGGPLSGTQVVALYPNKTWMQGETDTFGRVSFGFHSDLPITVFCAAPGFTARVERDWRPTEPLSVQLEELPAGGSTVFPERTGRLPGLTGRLNPILDDRDRMYLYATNIAIDEGRQQPVHFKLNQPLRLTDVNGVEWTVRFVEMVGKSTLLEYEPPNPHSG